MYTCSFFHCFGCVIGTLAITTSGGTMVPVQEFSPAEVLRTVEQENVQRYMVYQQCLLVN